MTSTSFLVYFPLKHHTLSSDYVKATHTTASSTGNLTSIKQKQRLPAVHPTTKQPICACGTIVDMFGNHIFKCTHICKIGIHNAFHDGFAQALAPVLSTAGFVPPNSTVDTEPNLYLPSDPHSRSFNLSFDPYLAPPPLTSHGGNL